jgi:hypothetical protein
MKQTRAITGMCLLVLSVTLSACKDKAPVSSHTDTLGGVPAHNSPEAAAPAVATGDKIPLNILYVGLTSTNREKDFVSFLSENFTQVKAADLYAFKEEQAQASDVIILDKDGTQWGSEGGRPLSDLRLSNAYTKPTVSLGIPGAFWTSRMNLKTGYM